MHGKPSFDSLQPTLISAAHGIRAILHVKHMQTEASPARLVELALQMLAQEVQKNHGRSSKGQRQQQRSLAPGLAMSHSKALHALHDFGRDVFGEAVVA